MQRLQNSVFSLFKTTNLSPAVFSFLQPTDEFVDKTPLGGILNNSKLGWLALGPKFCVVDIKTGLKVAARTFGSTLSNHNTTVTSVIELPTPLTENSQQLVISLECDNVAGMICVFHINGSQILRCIQTDTVVTELAVCDAVTDGPFTCFDGVVIAGSKSGEIFALDLNRASLMQALKNISQGYEHLVRNEANPTNVTFLPLNVIQQIDEERHLAFESDDHLGVLLNENSLLHEEYMFRNPDGSVRMKAKRNLVRVSTLLYIPQLGSVAVGYNFGAFQIWNLMTLDLEFTSQVNVECLPVTHFGFQEPCDDPRAFCYLWVVFSLLDKFEEEEFPLAVMYSLTYQGKRMLSDTKCLYQDFLTATLRFQLELGTGDAGAQLVGGRCVACHTYSINSSLGEEGEDSMLNICHLVWECWSENANSAGQHGMLLFDLDQWYKDQMPATYRLESNAFMSTWCGEMSQGACTLHVRLDPASVVPYSHATRLEEHFFPNSLQYDIVYLNTSEACVLRTFGIQRQLVMSMEEVGPTSLLNPTGLYQACVTAGLAPLYADTLTQSSNQEDQRRFLLSVALEARLSRFLKRCAHDWATGSHMGVGCTLPFLVEWCWKRAIELKQNARELTAPLFTSSALPDRNIVRCLEHCVQQLAQLTSLLDAILTKCCNLVVPNALSEMEEKHKGVSTVALYFQVVQWFLRVGLLPERLLAPHYPVDSLANTYSNRRVKLRRLQDKDGTDEEAASSPCPLLYIDQLIVEEFGGERIQEMWIKGGSECNGLYPPPSLYSLLRLYLLPDVSEEHKHSLVLYLLLDYSMTYDEVRYEAIIRRLMQFPTMFGLSNTAIKATQAFWHLDHREFDYALDQLQCLTGNTLSEWQHNVVLSSLLAQRKTQAALQYLHVRKPAPIQNVAKDKDSFSSANYRISDHDKLEDWQSCCNLYLARQLVFQALDVVRMCVQNSATLDDKKQILNYFFKGCHSAGLLSKLLESTLLPFEEEVFIKYLESCNSPQTSDLLIMYYLQQARCLEAQQYNNKLRHSKSRFRDMSMSVESILEAEDRLGARDLMVEVDCLALPAITGRVANFVLSDRDFEPHPVLPPKPLSIFVQAKSPKNTFTYKSSFIQNTIDNASETWINKPQMRRGLKRALNIEETPFICTPKLLRTKSILSDEMPSESTPPKRPRLDLSTPKTPRVVSTIKVSEQLSEQMSILLDMPEVQSPEFRLYDRTGAETPHSILKVRRSEMLSREASSPVDSRYLGVSDDDMLETCSNHTAYSDSKLLRFTIPTTSESESTPSPPPVKIATPHVENLMTKESELSSLYMKEKEVESFATTPSHKISEDHPLESPPKKVATEDNVKIKKSYKDSVRARRSLSISVNSSLSDDPNTSIESIADIPITLINPRYSNERRKETVLNISKESNLSSDMETEDAKVLYERKGESYLDDNLKAYDLPPPKIPSVRRSIRSLASETSIGRNRSLTPERQDSRVITPRLSRVTRSRSRTPELSPRTSSLAAIPEQPAQEIASEPHAERSMLSVRTQRSRSRTPERVEKVAKESTKLEAITESPTKHVEEHSKLKPVGESPTKTIEELVASPTRRALRSRTPERVTPVAKYVVDSPTELPEAPTFTPTKRNFRRLRTPERTIDNAPSVSPKTPEMTEPPIRSPESISSPVRRSVRSRSRTPERITDKVITEKPELDLISEASLESAESPKISSKLITKSLESPIKSVESQEQLVESSTNEPPESPPSSPVRRSLRSRSRTPEPVQSIPKIESPQSLRSKKTPEKVSPALDRSTRNKKSLSRLVLEANTFAKAKQLEISESEERSNAEDIAKKTDDENIECTPMKSLRHVPSLMDITISPIFDKSVLQSSVESVDNSKTVDKSNEKPLPSFTINETCVGKSVLKSCESSVIDSPKSSEEPKKRPKGVKDYKNVSNLDNKQLAAFTTISDSFERSVLHNYESSEAGMSRSAQETNFSLAKEITTNDFYDEISSVSCRSVLRDGSSLITSDSDIEMRDTASEIERGKIVELEMEINEIEDNMSECSDDSENDGDTSDDEEILEAGEEEEEEEDEQDSENSGSEESRETDTSASNHDDEIISINDSDSNESSEFKLQIDESKDTQDTEDTEIKTHKSEQKLCENITEVDKETCDGKVDISASIEDEATDPANQAGLSILTDDNSELDIDHSIEGETKDDKNDQESKAAIHVEVIVENIIQASDANEKVMDVDVDSVIAKEKTYDTEEKNTFDRSSKNQQKSNNKNIEKVDTFQTEVDIVETSTDKNILERGTGETPQSTKNKSTSSDSSRRSNEEIENEDLKAYESKSKGTMETSKQPQQLQAEMKEHQDVKIDEKHEKEIVATEGSEQKLEKLTTHSRKRNKSTSSNISQKDNQENEGQNIVSKQIEVPKTPLTRKRAKSITSNISATDETNQPSESVHGKDSDSQIIDDQKTPMTRKRTKSVASNKSTSEETHKTPENIDTSPKTRAKTPSSTEVRKIITRRVSKELTEKADETSTPADSIFTTPKRRSSRAKSNVDDNASVASDSSVKSSKSKMSEEGGDVKAMPVRKGRKSIVTKPDLSVIPENTSEENSIKGDTDMKDYSSSRRLTRYQKSVLEATLEPPTRPAPRSRRTSTASRTSAISEHSVEEDDASSTASTAYEDRIALLNKTDYEGVLDDEELRLQLSLDSIASEATKQRRARIGRAASETKNEKKLPAAIRRVSVDIDSPVAAGGDSPARGRRASFNRACEALHTPTKGRRTSTDLKKGDSESGGSPVSDAEVVGTPRRLRRASTHSNTSQTTTRSKTSTAVEDN